jgi:hypothetical protein
MPNIIMPLACPTISRMMGSIKKKLLCCASSEDFALAEPRTIRLIEIIEAAGETRNKIMAQFIFGITIDLVTIKSIVSITTSITANEKTDTAMLNKNEASIFALKISFNCKGQ